jgi:hypothetical protein
VHEISDDDEFLVVACDGMFPVPACPKLGVIVARLTPARHLGLSVVTSCCRVRA